MGGVGLDGRPRSPVWLATGWGNAAERDGGRPSRPSPPLPATLAPTDVDGLFVRVMPIGRDQSGPYATSHRFAGHCWAIRQQYLLFGSFAFPVY